jgi:DNA-binding winged helix-turn-helix (wHTH) protein
MKAVADQFVEALAAARPSAAARRNRCATDSSPERILVAKANVSALNIVASYAESIGVEPCDCMREVALALADREMRQRLQLVIQAYDLLAASYGTSAERGFPPEAESLAAFSCGRVFSFGPFQLFPSQRLLLEGNRRVHLGSQAFDILTILVERAGEVVSKQELIGRAWPNVFVEDSNLKTQISGLRRALREARAGRCYIVTVPRRGYNFVAPVISSEGPALDRPDYRRSCGHDRLYDRASTTRSRTRPVAA